MGRVSDCEFTELEVSVSVLQLQIPSLIMWLSHVRCLLDFLESTKVPHSIHVLGFYVLHFVKC